MPRRSIALTGVVAIVASGCVSALPQPALDDTLVFTHANIIDGVSIEPLLDRTVVVRGGRISAIERSGAPVIPGATLIDLAGRWLIPGLIDAHVHIRDFGSAPALLSAGVTTARSLGVDNFGDVAIRDQHRSGATELPDILAAGYQVRRRMADAFFADFPAYSDLRSGVSGDSAVRVVIRAIVGRNTDVIKVMSTNRAGVSGVDFHTRMLSNAELKAAVDEASSANLPVAAHAHTDDGVRAAVLAGVRTIEHGTRIERETLLLMRDRQTCLVPTLSFWKDMAEPGGEYDAPDLQARGVAMMPVARQTVLHAAELGVKLVAGSDMRYDSTSPATVADEVAELIRTGVDPMVAIRAATSVAAECLGIHSRTGSVRPFLEADLLVLEDNPLLQPKTLKRPRLIMNNGNITMNLLGSESRHQQ